MSFNSEIHLINLEKLAIIENGITKGYANLQFMFICGHNIFDLHFAVTYLVIISEKDEPHRKRHIQVEG